MTKDELITKQQLEIEEMKSILEANKSIISDLHFKISNNKQISILALMETASPPRRDIVDSGTGFSKNRKLCCS